MIFSLIPSCFRNMFRGVAMTSSDICSVFYWIFLHPVEKRHMDSIARKTVVSGVGPRGGVADLGLRLKRADTRREMAI